MKERPILFSGPMVRAILDGRKTQTRRVVKLINTLPDGGGLMAIRRPGGQTCLPLINGVFQYRPFGGAPYEPYPDVPEYCPYGKPGDRLWVRETWAAWDSIDDREASELDCSVSDMVEMGISQGHISYRADPQMHADRWRPSIFMPRWASRLTLEVTAVRVERLQAISRDDAIAEGIHKPAGSQFWHTDPSANILPGDTPQWAYRNLWESINGAGSWELNPFVWVIEFRRVP